MNTLIYNYFVFDLISQLGDFNINSFWINRNIAKTFNPFFNNKKSFDESFWKSQNRKACDLIF